MSKCSICGAELPAGTKFCTNCGTPVPENIAPNVAATNNYSTPVEPAAPSEMQQPAQPEVQQPVQPEVQQPVQPEVQQPVQPEIQQSSTAFQQAVTSNNQPKNIYNDVPQYGQPNFNEQPAFNAQQNFNEQPAFNAQQNFNGQQNFNAQQNFNGQQNFNAQPLSYGQVPVAPKKNKTGLVIGLIVGAVALLAIVIGLVLFISNRNTYKTPINKFEKGINKRDASELMEAFPLDKKYSPLVSSLGDSLLSEYDNEFDDSKIDIKVTDKEKLTSSELDDAEDSYFASMFGSDYDLTDGYYVYCDITATIDGEKETETVIFTVCKWDGKWYIFDLG